MIHRSFIPTLAALLGAFLASAHANAATLTINVTVPANTPPADTIHIAGDFQGWNPGDPAYALTEQPDGRHTIILSLFDNTTIQFKFTRGTWAKVEKGPSGEEIGNRTHTAVGAQTLNLTVHNWADIQPSTITGNVESFTFAPFLNGRRIWVYLPPGYDQSTAHYPVLYMHDGQNLFDDFTAFAGEWHADEAAQSLIINEEIEPLIIVGIENGPARCFEYTPYADPALSCSGGGEPYLQAIINTLIPEINARYRTRTGPSNTYISGSSLGGLISAYAAWAHADVFGRAAAVSPSYWANQDLFDFAQTEGRPPTLERFYQDMGTGEGPTQINHLRTMRDIALAEGFTLADDLMHVEAPGAGHNEGAWSARFPDILRFLINPPPACAADLDADNDTDVLDFAIFATAFGASLGDPNYNPAADLDNNNTINVLDFTPFTTDFGCPN